MLKVLNSGFSTSIQDLGRFGFADIGVSVSGAMDSYSANFANAILNNKQTDAILEITFGNSKFQFIEPTVITITGADFNATINNTKISLNTAIQINVNDVLVFKNQNYGVRTYLSVLGGFQTEKVLNSRSFFNQITAQTKLEKGDKIPYKTLNKTISKTFSSVKIDQQHFNSTTINCYKGPEFDWLSDQQIQQLTTTSFSISNDNNRMGYRLEQEISNQLPSMLTSAVLPGTVQLTPSGKLIVLMRDCQVTGGYPRVLVLTKEAINQLAQKTTNDSFQFKLLNL